MLVKLVMAGVACGVMCAAPAAGQVRFGGEGWSGEAGVSATMATGNTETTDLGATLAAQREAGLWRFTGSTAFDYAEAESEETKNRFEIDGQIDRILRDNLFAFGATGFEQDAFDGFEYRALISAGVGWKVFDTEVRTWDLQGGPGLQIDAFEDTVDETTGAVITPGETTETLAAALSSRYGIKLSDAAKLTNDTDLTFSEDTTIMTNSLALTTTLMDSLAARFSVDVRHDTEPPVGAESTDTTTRASLVYSFGATE